MSRVIALIVPLALLILAAACGNTDTPPPTATVPAIPTSTPTPTPSKASSDNFPTSSLLEALDRLHLDSPEGVLKFADYESARIASGDEDFKGMETWNEKGTDSTPYLYAGLPQIKHLRELSLNFHRDVGVDVIGLDFAIWTEGPGIDYPHFMMLKGGFDEEEVVDHLLDFDYRTETYSDVAYYYYWVDGEARSALRHPIKLGLAGHKFLNAMAPMDDWLLGGTFVNTVTSLIDAKQSADAGLIRNLTHKLLAGSFEGVLLGGAFLTEEFVLAPWIDGSKSTEDLESYIRGDNKWGKLTPYDLALMGHGIKDGEMQLMISLYYSDPDAAARDAQELERRWNSFSFNPNTWNPNTQWLPVTNFCSPLSTETRSFSDHSILSATCEITDPENEMPIGSSIWTGLLEAHELQILVPNLEELSDRQAAVEIVRGAGVIEQIAGDQPWTASRFFRRSISGTTDGGMKFDANWDQPVESSGPWQDLECRDSLAIDFSSTWANITRVHVYVDIEHREVVGVIVPGPQRPEEGQRPTPSDAVRITKIEPDDRITVHDLESRKVTYDGSLKDAPEEVLRCPPGKEDD